METAVLVAIAIPIFTSQLEKAREATDAANIRDAYAEIAVGLIDGSLDADGDTMTISGAKTATLNGDVDADFTVTIDSFAIKQTGYTDWAMGDPEVAGVTVSTVPGSASVTLTFEFTVSDGNTYLSDITFA